MSKNTPQLFGLDNSNRDFSSHEAWGKNQFNSSFPASLCCFLHSIGSNANYLSICNGKFICTDISILDAFKISPTDPDIYFAFEASYTPFQKYIIGTLPRTDLVIQRKSDGACLTGLEVKLTALPDNTTCELNEQNYGSEIVIRPDTIAYLACSIAKGIGDNLRHIVKNIEIPDWSEASQTLPFISNIISTLRKISIELESKQTPFLLQPIWKTIGKSPQLDENCLDVFFWSDAGFVHFITEIANNNPNANKITRQTRTAIWLYKMLLDLSQKNKFDHNQIIDTLSYNTKNDKAFASAGNITNKFMYCDRLKNPKIKKSQIKNIILGGGQNLLSPERRFDAIIYNSPELFK